MGKLRIDGHDWKVIQKKSIKVEGTPYEGYCWQKNARRLMGKPTG